MADFITGQSLIVFGLAVVVFVFLMRRTFLRNGSAGARISKSVAGSDAKSAAESPEMVAEMLEVRLFDFAREVEGRMQTRIAVLDRLIVDADREILRLQDVLAATTGASPQALQQSSPQSSSVSETALAEQGPARQPDALVGLPPQADRKEAA